jgi:hypothetical protein
MAPTLRVSHHDILRSEADSDLMALVIVLRKYRNASCYSVFSNDPKLPDSFAKFTHFFDSISFLPTRSFDSNWRQFLLWVKKASFGVSGSHGVLELLQVVFRVLESDDTILFH